jgi:ribose/xylose/arabinose/galactoside ABC-type transport system permease subunit
MSGITFAMLTKFVAFPMDAGDDLIIQPGEATNLLPWLFALAAIAVGAAIGFLNGILVAVIGIPSIIATLAMLFVFEGVSLIVGSGQQYRGRFGKRPAAARRVQTPRAALSLRPI